MRRCISCFKEFKEEFDICPFCGSVIDMRPVEPIHLAPGTILAHRYYLGKAVGSGGFGIIYKAWDSKLETIVAVKEFFVTRIITRAAGQKEIIVNRKSEQEYEYRKDRFLAEARNMAKFGAHRNIPNVFEFFEENGTAYIVMELLEGQTLKEFMHENGGQIDRDFAIMITHEVGNALTSLHEKGIIHRDVAPDNIYICTGSDIRIKLLDLGAAKLADSSDEVIDIILKPGYSPTEQYDNTSNIGPWTDIYALGATLYVMLTGVKPDESTNRKIEDKVPYPKEIVPSISENLSNAVMKAMAVEKHMRFNSVETFIQAIDGERKVIPIKKEKKRRIRNRILGVVAALLIVAVGGIFLYKYYEKKRSVQVLHDTEISVWYCADSGSDEEIAMNAVIDDFRSVYPNVVIDLQCYPSNEYVEKLREAASNNALPTLYESTDVPQEILDQSLDVTNVLESDQAGDCLFLNQYENYYADCKRVPLGIEVPVAYVITSGNTSIDYQMPTFASLENFNGTAIAIDEDYSDLLNRNGFGNGTASKSQFMQVEGNECAVLISSSMELNEVRSTLLYYEKTYVYYDADTVQAGFTYEWSMGGGNNNQVAASERLLSWMLGNKYQNMLMISRCSEGQIPVNAECYASKAESVYYSTLKETKDKYYFTKES